MQFHKLTVCSAIALIAATASGQQRPPQQPDPPQTPDTALAPAPIEGIDLEALVREVAASSGKEFLIDPRARRLLVVAGTPIGEVTYPVLLSILRLNGYAAIEIEGRVNIVPDAMIRQLAPPLVQTDDPNIPDDEWVMRIIDVPDDGVENRAAILVPVLRPLMPQAAHFAAFPATGKLILVDRYANVRRVTAIIEAFAQ